MYVALSRLAGTRVLPGMLGATRTRPPPTPHACPSRRSQRSSQQIRGTRCAPTFSSAALAVRRRHPGGRSLVACFDHRADLTAQGRAPYPGSPGEGGDEADEAVDLEGAINRAQVALSEVQMSESRLVDLIASSSSSVDALLGLLLSLVRPLVEQPPAEVAMYYAQRPGRGAARQKPGPGRDDQMLLALIDAGNHGKSFAWLLRDSARMW